MISKFNKCTPWLDHDVMTSRISKFSKFTKFLGSNRKISKIGQKPGKPGPKEKPAPPPKKTLIFHRNSTLTPFMTSSIVENQKNFIIFFICPISTEIPNMTCFE